MKKVLILGALSDRQGLNFFSVTYFDDERNGEKYINLQ